MTTTSTFQGLDPESRNSSRKIFPNIVNNNGHLTDPIQSEWIMSGVTTPVPVLLSAVVTELQDSDVNITDMLQNWRPHLKQDDLVLRPPGGGSSFSFGLEGSKQQQPVRRHKMASNIFGIPDDEPAPTSCASEPGPSESAACGDDPHRTCTQAEYSDAVEETGEAEVPETEPAKEASGDAASVAVHSRRNPPGGKSSLVLG